MTDQPSIGVGILVAFVCRAGDARAAGRCAGHGLVERLAGLGVGRLPGVRRGRYLVAVDGPDVARRLENPRRFVVEVMLFLTVALYAAAGGLTWWGIAFAVVAIAAFGSRVRRILSRW